MLQKHYPIETFDDPLNGYVAAFDPGYQIFRQFGRGRNPAVAEQLDDEVAEQRAVGLLDPDLRGGRPARAQIGQRHPPGRQWIDSDAESGREIGSANVWTTVTNTPVVSRVLI